MTTLSDILRLCLLCTGSVLVIAAGIYGPARDAMRRSIWTRRIKSARAAREATQDPAATASDPLLKQKLLSVIGGLALAGFIIINDPVRNWDLAARGFIIVLTMALFYRIPQMRIEHETKKRRRAIEHDMPAVLDLIVVMLDSGATFDLAISRLLSEKHFDNRPIKDLVARLASELELHPNREAAFRKLEQAAEMENFRVMTSALVHSERYGTPVSTALRSLASDMRQKQFHRVEEKSGALGPKLTIPMTLFFLPLIFIIVLAPTLIRTFKLP